MPEQWNRFVAGPVVTQFLELPPVENATEQFRSKWSEREGFGALVRTFMENPNTKEAVAFLLELLSSEVFVFGDKNGSQWYSAQARLNDDMRSVAVKSDLDEVERTQEIIANMLTQMDDLTVPVFMFGAKCKDIDLALGKIDQLEAVIQLGISAEPNLSLAFKNFGRVDDARGDRLQLRLDGSQIPWDDIPTNAAFTDELLAKIREKVDKKSITLIVGMFDGFFVVGAGPSSKALLELGKAKSMLENPELEVVKEMATSSLISVGYSSDALSRATFDAILNNFFSRNVVNFIGPVLGEIESDSAIRDFAMELLEDSKWMDESIAKLVPESKGATTYSVLTADGWERHVYLRTKNAIADFSAPLGMLDHMGADPMMFASLRLQNKPEYFQLARKIVQKVKLRMDQGYELDWSELGAASSLVDVLRPILSWFNSDWDWDSILETENLKSTLDIGWPFVVRVADLWENRFLPSMSGEHAVVLTGGNLASKQWLKDMPPSVDPLGLPELAALCGLKDRNMMQGAFEELFKICDDMVEAIRTNVPGLIPIEYKIPRPARTQSNFGEVFGYAIPWDYPVPKEMMPQALFADNLMIDSYSSKQTESLAAVSKLNSGKGIIDPSAKLSSASYINVGRIFEFARPWIRYALTEGIESMDDSLLDGTLPENYELTGKDLLSAWSVLIKIGEFASVSSSTPNGGSHIRSVYKNQKSD